MEGHASFYNCTDLTKSDIKHLVLARGLTAVICFIACLFTLVGMVAFMIKEKTCTKASRLFLYAIIVSLIYLFVLVFHLEHYSHYTAEGVGCKAVGYLDQATGFLHLLFMAWIAFYLLYKAFEFRGPDDHPLLLPHCNIPRLPEGCKCITTPCCSELRAWIVCTFLSGFIAAIPFMGDATPYGETGPWCWIKSLNNDCSVSKGGLAEQLLIWYIPFGGVALISFGSVIMITVAIWKNNKQPYAKLNNEKRKDAKVDPIEFIPLIALLVVYMILWLIELFGRITATYKNFYWLWMLYAISTSFSGFVIPFAFLASFICTVRRKNRNPQEAASTSYHTAREPESDKSDPVSSDYGTCNDDQVVQRPD